MAIWWEFAVRNWPQTLRQASYKGVPFFVDDEALPKSGRFVATHSFVKAESHATEDMGRMPREFRLAAYLASDSADQDVRNFVEMCSEAGPGALVLPMLGSQQVRCRGCHVKAKRDRLGYIELELDFIEAGTADGNGAGGGFPAAPLGDRLASAAQDEMPDQVEGTIAQRDTTARQQALTSRLDPGASLEAGLTEPASTDYQGSRADQSARDDQFDQVFN